MILNHFHRHGILTTLHNGLWYILYAVTNETVQEHISDVSHSTPLSIFFLILLMAGTLTVYH